MAGHEQTAKPVNLIVSCTNMALNANTALWILPSLPKIPSRPLCCCSFLFRCSKNLNLCVVEENALVIHIEMYLLYWMSLLLYLIVFIHDMWSPYYLNWPRSSLLWCVSVWPVSLFFFACQTNWLYSEVYWPWWIGY